MRERGFLSRENQSIPKRKTVSLLAAISILASCAAPNSSTDNKDKSPTTASTNDGKFDAPSGAKDGLDCRVFRGQTTSKQTEIHLKLDDHNTVDINANPAVPRYVSIILAVETPDGISKSGAISSLNQISEHPPKFDLGQGRTAQIGVTADSRREVDYFTATVCQADVKP